MNRKEQKPFKKITFDYEGNAHMEKCFENVSIITKEEIAVYSICMEVSSLDNIPVGMVGGKYSKSTYAVFKKELYMNYMSNENDEVEIYAPIVK